MPISKEYYEQIRSKSQARLLEWTTSCWGHTDGKQKGQNVNTKSGTFKGIKQKSRNDSNTVSVVTFKTHPRHKNGQPSDQQNRGPQNHDAREKIIKICNKTNRVERVWRGHNRKVQVSTDFSVCSRQREPEQTNTWLTFTHGNRILQHLSRNQCWHIQRKISRSDWQTIQKW